MSRWHSSALLLPILVAVMAAVSAPAPRGAQARGRTAPLSLDDATTALLSERSEKVRVQAALVLARTGDARATPFLIRALADRSQTVRAMAAEALGHVGDETARPGLEVAARDASSLVRRHALAALENLGERMSLSPIAVQPMGDASHRASGQLREHMRAVVAAELRGFGRRGGSYTVDGAIKTLAFSGRLDLVEVKCGVELVLSTAGRAIVMMSSGEAIVQRQRRQFRPAMQPSMELEALEHAVRGASDELRQHLAANVP